MGGPIAALREGDVIAIDIEKRSIQVELSDDEIKQRMAGWKAPAPHYKGGVFAKYMALVSSASKGAITDPNVHSIRAEVED